jgi:hypothetical protein
MLEQRRKQREESGRRMEGSQQSAQFSQDPTEEDLEEIGIPNDLHDLKDPEYYLTRIERAAQKIETEKQRRLANTMDDYATAMDKYVRAKEVYQAKENQLREINETCSRLRTDVKLRMDRWELFRDYISGYSGDRFDETRTSLLQLSPFKRDWLVKLPNFFSSLFSPS